MTIDDLIGDIFVREGDKYGDQTTTPPIDQPTARGGITLKTLQAFYDAKEPGRTATITDLKDMTHVKASEIIRWLLESESDRNHLSCIKYEPLRVLLIDFIYNSGAPLAMRWLQRVLRVPRTSKMDDATVKALESSDAWLVHHALIAARLQMVDMSTDGGSIDKRFEEGLENRVLSFSLLPIP